MIPVKLNLRNFLSYRENVPTLDFTGVHVACLCGDNGHGKSALLDAITWCLWGHARGQVQDDLVSYGADEARVELDFLARDGRFKVIRSRRRGGGRRRQGASDLQLVSVTEDGESTQVVSGNSIRETQARIEQLVGHGLRDFYQLSLPAAGDGPTSLRASRRRSGKQYCPPSWDWRPTTGTRPGRGERRRRREPSRIALPVGSRKSSLIGKHLGEPGEGVGGNQPAGGRNIHCGWLKARQRCCRNSWPKWLNYGLFTPGWPRKEPVRLHWEKSITRLEASINVNSAPNQRTRSGHCQGQGEIEAGAAMLAAAQERFAQLEGVRQLHDTLRHANRTN